MTGATATLLIAASLISAACGGGSGRDESTSTASWTSSTTAPTPTAPPIPETHIFPVTPAEAARYGRSHHDYPGADIFAPCGSAAVAVVPGVISETSTIDTWNPATDDPAARGGLSVTLVGDDGVRYYGSHLASIAEGIVGGARVADGAMLGTVGDTGNAAGTGCHLHFGISPPCGTGDWRVRRGTIPPAELLDAWRGDDPSASPVDAAAAWRAAHLAECP